MTYAVILIIIEYIITNSENLDDSIIYIIIIKFNNINNMGQRNSKQIAENIVSSISNNITNSISEISSSTDYRQYIEASCSDLGLITECISDCQKQVRESGNNDFDICNICNICSISDVNLNQSVIISSKMAQDSNLLSSIQNSVESSMGQYLENSNTDQQARNVINYVSQNLSQIINSIRENDNAIQYISISDISVRGVTLNQSIDIVRDFIQSNDMLMDNINDISLITSQSSKSNYNLILYITLAIISILIAIFGIVSLNKSESFKDFLASAAPYISFLIISIIITILHILIKPNYVSDEIPDSKDRELNTTKLVMYLFLYYTGLALSIMAIVKVKNKS